MRNGTTVAIEPTCVDAEHSPVNAAMLAAALEAFPRQPLIMAGSASHLAAIREILGPLQSNIDWQEMELPPRHLPPSGERRRHEFRLWKELFRKTVGRDTSRILALSSSESNMIPMKFWLWSRPSLPAVCVLHSVVGNLLASRQRRAEWRMAPPPRLRWVVLGSHIRKYVLGRFPAMGNRLGVLPHPLLPPAMPQRPMDRTGRIVFAFPGAATAEKGFPDFCRLAEAAAGKSSAEFALAGRLTTPAAGDLLRFVRTPCSPHARLSHETYHAELDRATYLVFPFRRDAYEYTASGSILDALLHGKPIIGYEAAPCIEAVFRALGDVGHLCGSWEEMRDTVVHLAGAGVTGRYEEQVGRMALGRRRYYPAALAGELAGLFEECQPEAVKREGLPD